MFIAKFSQVNGLTSKFKPNRHGQMPFIGEVLKGQASASIIDAAIFENEGLVAGQLYLCENGIREYKGTNYPTVQVVGPVSAAEYMTSASSLSSGRLVVPKAVAADDSTDTSTDDVDEIAAAAALALKGSAVPNPAEQPLEADIPF